ncbi:rho-type GTPase-activating protein 1-like isoform X2 [Megalobrama amblycephala]|uniref:rho-type GTPase-activating protein 1-like isoform X2 n=1 Tax=Megalobrama amblycephala TaxID=75352 RepID=UPI0020144977|nr:rho-type GTPase-activating protein 1-like isoform X2 [Megalobrama amblycephala]
MEMAAIGVLSVCVETQRAVFGVPLISLRKSGQMRQGLPLVLTHIVEFVEKHESKQEELNQAVRMILNSLPEEHFNVLCYLMFFLSRVAAESQLNLMTSKNLATVFGPTIFHIPLGPTMFEEQGLCNTLTEHLLNNLKHLLPNMYPHLSTGNTTEGDWTNEECVQQLPLPEIRSKLPKIGLLGRLRKRSRDFWRKICSCTDSNDIES